MIDLDRMEEQLTSALTVGTDRARRPPADALAPVPAPTPAPAPASAAAASRRRARPATPAPPAPRPAVPAPRPARPASAIELLELGLLEEADAAMTSAGHPRDVLCWATMRALLEGRRDAARTGIDELRRLAERTDDVEASEHWWIQRFWAAFEWGGDTERFDVLDHCRNRAYRFDDPVWWGNLTLLLAAMGKADEATRALDEATPLVAGVDNDRHRLDAATNLVDAATILGDAGRTEAAARLLQGPDGWLVVAGAGAVCKGALDRYRALGYVAAGNWKRADECFRRAESVHRDIGAGPLLARTREQASRASVAA